MKKKLLKKRFLIKKDFPIKKSFFMEKFQIKKILEIKNWRLILYYYFFENPNQDHNQITNGNKYIQ